MSNQENKRRTVKDFYVNYPYFKLGTSLLVILIMFLVFGQSTNSLSNTDIQQSYENNILDLRLSSGLIKPGGNTLIIGLTDNSSYDKDFSDDYDLFITLNPINGGYSGSYKYSGKLLFPIVYPLNTQGNYVVMLISKYNNNIVSSTNYYYYYGDIYSQPDSPSGSNITLQNNTLSNYSEIIEENISTIFPIPMTN